MIDELILYIFISLLTNQLTNVILSIVNKTITGGH